VTRARKRTFDRLGAARPRKPAKPVAMLPLCTLEAGRVVVWPIHTVSEANRSSSEPWQARHRRAKSQRGDATADAWGINDGDPSKVLWKSGPEQAAAGFGVRVEVRAVAVEGLA
jgi:hypothetical protein